MKAYDRITFLRNRVRARDLRRFRDQVEAYFEQAAYDVDDLPVDWEGARAARSQINRMLPRVMQIVRAAGLGASPETTDPGPQVGEPEVLRKIFSTRYADGGFQEVLDFIDMALGVYDANVYGALARTVNPYHYAATLLGFVAGIPRRVLGAIGLRRRRPPRMASSDVARVEAAAARLADVEELIDQRFAALRERQSQQAAEQSRQLEEIAERLDFTERMLAQRDQPKQLEMPNTDKDEVITPV